MRLVADVGGTNARLALARDGAVLAETVRSYRNDDFDSFLSLARVFIEEADFRNVSEAVVAVAGPVWGQRAKLTNRDWHFDTTEISDILGVKEAALMNDLTALGHALPALSPSQVLPVVHADRVQIGPSQSLIVGIGTGFNVCPVLHDGQRVQCLEVEFGHVSLPISVVEAARPTLGNVSEMFPTVEECFSGRGYQSVIGNGGTPDTYATLMAALSRDLMMAFMPRSGIYFNGGVARSVLTSPAQSEFVRDFQQPCAVAPDLSVPVGLINDDTAALIGCASLDF